MGYIIQGVEHAVDEQGYLLEPVLDDEAARVIAQAEDIVLTDAHWDVIRYLREQYREHGHTPNFRNMLKGMAEIRPDIDSKALYDLFPIGPAKQGPKVAGLPQPLGKGGY
jgi:tRNA 2-thiouridine synthesizing protein E